MKNFAKIYILFILFILLFIPCVKASPVNMDLDYNTSTISDTEDNEDYLSDNSVSNTTSSNSTYNTPTVTTTSSNNTEFLTIENILSIIIIVIGIILIFLGIAIIIRCK